MLSKTTELNSKGIALGKEQAGLLRHFLGDDPAFALYDGDEDISSLAGADTENPCLLWISPAFCRRLATMPPEEKQILAPFPKVVLLDEGYTLNDFEIASDCGAMEIIRPPLTRERVADIMRRAIEAQIIQYDVHCMTREIMLERELLERKNELLNFLVNFLTNTSESLDLEYILENAYSGLRKLLPVHGMQAVLWEKDNYNKNFLSLYISAPENTPAHQAWREALLEQARLNAGREFSVQSVSRLHLCDQPQAWLESGPEQGVVLPLPIVNGTERLGVLLLLTSMERHLGRDQATALDSAMRHFALSIKNALRFRLVQMHADYDTLTKVHSRRHFESQMDEEMRRFTRYGQPTSVIMLDIDHFKKVNDSRGHHVGDIVLREVAALIAEGIRNTDYCARYGGEEFAVILPHTNAPNALILAERLRRKIARRTFLPDSGDPLKITVSMGVASLEPGEAKSRQTLLCEADAALYAAKQNGRNCTVDTCAGLPEPQANAS